MFRKSLTNCNLVVRQFSLNALDKLRIEVSEEVRNGLQRGKSVVALESTIITHGMPFPENVKCAQEVENIVRSQGAIPATIAILKGVIKVGLNPTELAELADTQKSKPIKTSRRDLCYIISNQCNGGTTVSGTLIVANKVGIPIFATGGIGGVHRGAANTFDISADLTELGRTGVAVISSGVKSILDIPKTLEFLETQGVFVATFGGSLEFPAFYSRKSGFKSAYTVQTALEAAKIIKCNRELDLRSGMLFGVPVPEQYSLPSEVINSAIEEALSIAKDKGDVLGKDITPFLLDRVAKLTAGKSLETNIALIKNNAKVAAEIAVELEKLQQEKEDGWIPGSGRPVVIGGSNLDCSATLDSSEIKLDGRIHECKFSYSAGGVARNICEALSKLGNSPHFISALGSDEQGKLLKSLIPKECRDHISLLESKNTAQCVVVFDREGDCKLLFGNMDIHKEITPELIKQKQDFLKDAPLIVFDGNLSLESIDAVLKIADEFNIPTLYEPTDLEISIKPFKTKNWRAVKYITPNFNELKFIAKYFNITWEEGDKIIEAANITRKLCQYIDNILVTLGEDGVLICRRNKAENPVLGENDEGVSARHYPVIKREDIVNVSGAGDCFASGFICGMIAGLDEDVCVSIGFAAAEKALKAHSAVPEELFYKEHSSWKTRAKYIQLF